MEPIVDHRPSRTGTSLPGKPRSNPARDRGFRKWTPVYAGEYRSQSYRKRQRDPEGSGCSGISRLRHSRDRSVQETQKSSFRGMTATVSRLVAVEIRRRANVPDDVSWKQSFTPRYVPTRSLRSCSSLSLSVPNRKTRMAKSKSFSSVGSCVWNKLTGHLSSISTLPAFRKRLKHRFLRAFPGNSSPSTGITFCDVSPSTDATQVRHTPLPS